MTITSPLGSKLEYEKDYNLLYENNVNVGMAKLKIIPPEMGISVNENSVEFEINPIKITNDKISVSVIPDQVYTGSEIMPVVTIIDKTI